MIMMSPTFYVAVLLHILVSYASGDGSSITCPVPMKRATEKHHSVTTIQCILNSTDISELCKLSPTRMSFALIDSSGLESYSMCASDLACTGSETSTTQNATCGCLSTNSSATSYFMTFYPSIFLYEGSLTCGPICSLKNTSIPVTVTSHGCDRITTVDSCGGCNDDDFCDESVPKCESKSKVPIWTIVVMSIFGLLLIVCAVALVFYVCRYTRKVSGAGNVTQAILKQIIEADKKEKKPPYTFMPPKAYKEGEDVVVVTGRCTYWKEINHLAEKIKDEGNPKLGQ